MIMDFEQISESKTPEQLVQTLRELYAQYISDKTNSENKKSWGEKVIRNMLKSSASDGRDIRFYESVEAMCSCIQSVLNRGVSDPGLAGEAVEFMLFDCHEGVYVEACGLMLTACEFHCVTLLPFLTAEHLSDIRTAYVRRTPKIRMLPRQRKLLSEMDRLLK